MWIDGEPSGVEQLAPEWVEGGVGHLDDRAAPFAHQMVMDLACQVPSGGAVPEVDVECQFQTLEKLQCPVDRGQVHVGVRRTDRIRDLVGSEVVRISVEHFDHRPAVDGGATS